MESATYFPRSRQYKYADKKTMLMLLQCKIATPTHDHIVNMSQFTEVHVKALALQHPLKFANSPLSAAKLREASVSSSLISRLENHLSALNVNVEYIKEANITDFVAKAYNIGIECPSTEHQDRLWIFSATFVALIGEFDDYFDKPISTPESVARLSMEMRAILRALSRHSLGGLQGDLDDWPTAVPCKEAYLWLLREGEDLRKGAAELIHSTFNDYCLGIESEIVEWAPDLHRGDMTAWNLDRCIEVRKRSVGAVVTMALLFVVNKWMTRKHYSACNNLLYDAAIVIGLANDALGVVEKESQSIGIQPTRIVSADEVVQCHNEKVECLRKDIKELDGDTRRFMEEMETSAAGLFLWHCNCKRYID